MAGEKRFFFEIPIYRISHDRFNQEYDDALLRHWENFAQLSGYTRDNIPETSRLHVEQHFWETYGGPWHYNQVIGWVRLYILGLQVRGDLWRMVGKRYTRKSRNQIRLIGKILEIHFGRSESSEEILTRVEQRLQLIRNEWHKSKRVLDLECFQTLAPCINWRALLDN